MTLRLNKIQFASLEKSFLIILMNLKGYLKVWFGKSTCQKDLRMTRKFREN
ncbi:hypothetical protein P308_00850 [Pseudomonas piscis]|nr:hypothetical protein P308_00850 [Pseudomonas piscis]